MHLEAEAMVAVLQENGEEVRAGLGPGRCQGGGYTERESARI